MNSPTHPSTNPAPSRKNSSPMLIVVALGLGLLTVVLTNTYIRAVRNEVTGSSVYVYRFNKNLEAGEEVNIRKYLTPVMVSDKLKDGIKAMGIIVDVKSDAPINYNGQSINRGVTQGEFLSSALFTGTGQTVDNKVDTGKRGTPLEVNSRNAPGLLRPGMYIDLSANFTRPGDKIPQAMRVMEHVKVIAVGAMTDETPSSRRINYNTITIETYPKEELQLLTIAKFVGKDGFDVSIRNPADNDYRTGVNPEVLRLLGIDQ